MMRRVLSASAVLFLFQLASIPLHAQVSDVDRLYQEGVAARRAGQEAVAVERFREAARIQPDNSDVQVQLGITSLNTGDLNTAETAFNRALQLAPDYTDAIIGKARLALRRGQPDLAAQILAPVLAAPGGNEDARALAAQIKEAGKETPAAAPRAAVNARPAPAARPVIRKPKVTVAAPLADQAAALRKEGRLAEAEQRYAEALKRRPVDADLLIGMGLTQGSQGRYAEAQGYFQRALVIAPTSREARLGLARVSLWSGDHDEAENLVDAILASTPADPEALALRARIHLATGQVREAEADFTAVTAAHPGNVEALIGLGDARRALGRELQAREAYQRALAADPASADALTRLAAEPPARWRLDIDGVFSRLSGNNENWREGVVRLGHEVRPGTVISGGLEASERFGQFDTYMEGRIDHRLAPWLTAYGLAGVTPEADFRPRYQVGAGAGLRVLPGMGPVLGPTVVTLDFRHAQYDTGGTQTVSPGVEQYLFGGRLWITARWINTMAPGEDRTSGWFLRADAQVLDRLRLFAGASDAPDISDGIVLETFSLFGGAAVDLTERVSLRASLTREERRVAYDRTVISLGMGLKF
jgi:YaiO family outer membrane protein